MGHWEPFDQTQHKNYLGRQKNHHSRVGLGAETGVSLAVLFPIYIYRTFLVRKRLQVILLSLDAESLEAFGAITMSRDLLAAIEDTEFQRQVEKFWEHEENSFRTLRRSDDDQAILDTLRISASFLSCSGPRADSTPRVSMHGGGARGAP